MLMLRFITGTIAVRLCLLMIHSLFFINLVVIKETVTHHNSAMIKKAIFYCVLFCGIIVQKVYAQQIANYIQNGSFEVINNCQGIMKESKAFGWSGLDSLKF